MKVEPSGWRQGGAAPVGIHWVQRCRSTGTIARSFPENSPPFMIGKGDVMIHQSRPTRKTSRPRLESLESRELLSVLGATARPAAEASILAKRPAHVQIIEESISGQAVQMSGGDLQGQDTLNATGQGSSLGAIVFAGQVDFQTNLSGVHTVNYTNGSGTITALGGEIFTSFSGSGKHTGPSKFSLSLHGTVTGGTGQYAGAKGPFAGLGSINDQVETFALSLKLKLSE
jgi:hypothetical protein